MILFTRSASATSNLVLRLKDVDKSILHLCLGHFKKSFLPFFSLKNNVHHKAEGSWFHKIPDAVLQSLGGPLNLSEYFRSMLRIFVGISIFFINLLTFLKSYLTKADHSTKYCTPGEGFPISGTRSNETFGAISSKILLRWIFSAKEEHQETVSRVSKLAEEEFRCSTCQVGQYCIFCVCYYLVK